MRSNGSDRWRSWRPDCWRRRVCAWRCRPGSPVGPVSPGGLLPSPGWSWRRPGGAAWPSNGARNGSRVHRRSCTWSVLVGCGSRRSRPWWWWRPSAGVRATATWRARIRRCAAAAGGAMTAMPWVVAGWVGLLAAARARRAGELVAMRGVASLSLVAFGGAWGAAGVTWVVLHRLGAGWREPVGRLPDRAGRRRHRRGRADRDRVRRSRSQAGGRGTGRRPSPGMTWRSPSSARGRAWAATRSS